MSKIFAKTMALTMFVLPIDCNDHVEPASYLQRPQNDSPIHDAARKGDVATLTKLLDTGLQSCNMQRLVFEAHQACVQAVPNNFEGYEWPPLHDAVFAGHIEAASLLLQRGAAVNAKSRNFGSTALHWAAYVSVVFLTASLPCQPQA
eukprot:SAG31_NODE_10515_length_1129_cov_1.634951_1_plen_147_part_00